MKINHNSLLLNTLSKQNLAMKNIMAQLASGKRINSAGDDAAGQAISARLTSNSNSLNIGSRNLSDGDSMLRTADGAAKSATDVLQRMRELSTQASNGTYGVEDRKNMQAEIDQLKTEYDKIVEGVEFNGNKLLTNNNSVDINSGTNMSSVQGKDLRTVSNGGTNPNIDLSIDVTDGEATTDIAKIDAAINQITTARASFGASSAGIKSALENNATQYIASERSKSQIEDADLAKAMTEMTKATILSQAGIQMLKVQNQNDGTLLKLF